MLILHGIHPAHLSCADSERSYRTWPATIALDFTCFTTRQAKVRSWCSSSGGCLRSQPRESGPRRRLSTSCSKNAARKSGAISTPAVPRPSRALARPSSRRFFLSARTLRASRRNRERQRLRQTALPSSLAVAASTFRLKPDHGTEGRHGIRFIGLHVGFTQALLPIAVPQGLVCLMTQHAGSSNSRTRFQAASRSTMLL